MTGRGRPYIGRTIEVRLPDEVVEALEYAARRDGIPRAELCRDILTDWTDGVLTS